jgi:GTP-binding protein
LKVLAAEFVTSAAAGGDTAGIPRDRLSQVALAGRSNVGKSSLINALCRRKIARTSAAPGKTRLANIYRVTLEGFGPGRRELYLVDLPGYGYARGGADSAQELRAVAESYLSAVKPLALLLVDSRHPGLESDTQAARWLDSLGVSRQIVATKIDKLSRAERVKNLKTLGNTFGSAVLPVSAESGEGLDELWRMIVRIGKGADKVE